MSRALKKSFYNREPVIVARELLGKVFVRKIDGVILKGRIVETEAYLSKGDEAAHGFKGRTRRNESLYKEASHAYVHAMRQYFLLDLVTESRDVPSSVLIRAVEPTEGIDLMKAFRRSEILEDLASGPSKFCMAFGITKEFDGFDTTKSNAPFFVVESDDRKGDFQIENSGRIGISRATDAPLRFWIKGSPFVSKSR